MELGCVAIAAPERRFTYAIAAGDASRFSVGAADGSLRYVGSGEHAARTPEYALTVAAAPDDGGAALRVAVRVVIVANGGQAARRAPVVEFGLAGFGRAAAADAVQVIGRRFALMRRAAADLDTPHPTVTVHGRSLDLAGVRAQASGEPVRGAAEAPGHRVQPHGEAVRQAPSGAQLLAGSAFNAAGGARWGAWGSGNLSRFGGAAGGVRQDGTVLSGYLGADYRFAPNALAGLAGSYATLDLASTSDLDDDATLQGRLVHLYPYAWWMPEEWLGIWGVAGFGIGTAEFSDGAGSLQGDLRSWLGAAGQRTELWSGGGVSLAATADGFVTGIGSAGRLPDVQAHAWRARLMMEAGVDARLADARLSGLFNLGTRLDGGDAGQGLGAEASVEIGVTHVGSGLGLTGRGRLLLAHEDRDLRDWAASATLSWQPPDHGPGLAVSLAPAWGEPARGGDALARDAQALPVDRGAASAGGRSPWLPDTVDLTVRYGVDLPHGAGRLTPFAEIGFEPAAARPVRAGATLQVSDPAAHRDLALETYGQHGAAGGREHTFQLGFRATLEY